MCCLLQNATTIGGNWVNVAQDLCVLFLTIVYESAIMPKKKLILKSIDKNIKIECRGNNILNEFPSN